jgi:hypothetical protein
VRNFSTKSLTIALALTLTLSVAPSSFAAGRQDPDRTRDRRGAIERIIESIRRFIVTIQDIPVAPIP